MNVHHMVCTTALLLCPSSYEVLDQKIENFFVVGRETTMPRNTEIFHTLVWQENFDSQELNADTWNVLDDAFGYGNRQQHYTPRNIDVQDGLLKLLAKEEWSEGMPYTSAAVTTKGKVVFTHGKIEVRAKMPNGVGLLPAIWLWTNNGNEFPEIDIVEILGQEPGKAWATIHYESRGIYAKTYGFSEFPDLTKDFHTYGVEWHSDSITFLIDGAVLYTTPIFFQPEEMYLFINIGIGGDWVGEPDDTTEFPKELHVDWIKYYK